MKPLNRPKIKKFFNKNVQMHDVDLVFVLLSFESPFNVGHIFRLADATGAKKVILTGRTPTPPNSDIAVTSMGQEARVDWKHYGTAEEALKELKADGYKIVSLEVTDKSIEYGTADYGKKVCLVLGNEVQGVYDSVLAHSDEVVYIPMYGKNYSLNVHVAASIVAYKVIEQD